ncbi:MAG: YggT family protein [Candidatus Hydrogenedentes bacterium]|nr:YggT family protein [Candidatus Hydrogenedentota bacterium]
MIEISLLDVAGRAVNAAFTLYMMALLLRWLAPYLQVDMDNHRVRWICRLTDPLIRSMRAIATDKLMLPRFSALDYGPMLALFVVWIARAIVVGVLARATMGG